MKIAVVTDSTAYITPQQIGDLPIRVVTTPLFVNGETYNEGVDITSAEFFAKMHAAKEFPKTSQPRLGDILQIHRELLQQGYDTVIDIYLSNTISGVQASVRGALDQFKNQKVVVYDSQITVVMLGEMVLAAGRMAKVGASLDEILAQLDVLRASTGEYFIVDNLQHLVRGGRLSSTAGFIAGVLDIKPLLTFDDSHKIVVAEKIHSLKKAYTRVNELFDQAIDSAPYPLKAWVLDTNDPEAGERWQKDLQNQFPQVAIGRAEIGPAIGVHVGEGTMALAWMKAAD